MLWLNTQVVGLAGVARVTLMMLGDGRVWIRDLSSNGTENLHKLVQASEGRGFIGYRFLDEFLEENCSWGRVCVAARWLRIIPGVVGPADMAAGIAHSKSSIRISGLPVGCDWRWSVTMPNRKIGRALHVRERLACVATEDGR